MSLNYLAIWVATTVFFGIGAVWYTVFSKQWLNAIERTTEDMKKMSHMPTPWFPFVLSFVVNGAYFLIGMVVFLVQFWRPGGSLKLKKPENQQESEALRKLYTCIKSDKTNMRKVYQHATYLNWSLNFKEGFKKIKGLP